MKDGGTRMGPDIPYLPHLRHELDSTGTAARPGTRAARKKRTGAIRSPLLAAAGLKLTRIIGTRAPFSIIEGE